MRRGFVLSRRRAFWLTNALHALLEAQELATDVLFGTHNVRGWWDTAGDLTAGLLGSGSYLWVGRTTWADRDYVLFHRIADLDSAAVRREIAARGLKPLIDFQNIDSEEGRQQFQARKGTRVPALWDGEGLVIGRPAVLARLGDLGT